MAINVFVILFRTIVNCSAHCVLFSCLSIYNLKHTVPFSQPKMSQNLYCWPLFSQHEWICFVPLKLFLYQNQQVVQPTLARDSVSVACTGNIRTSLGQHARIGIIAVLYAHTTVALHPLHPTTLEASGYRSPTWRILRALKGCSEAKVLVGESMITAAPFFEGAGRPSKPYWGPQQGRRVILWESLSPEDQQKCLTELQNDEEWVVWCKANPKDKTTQSFREYGRCIFEGKRAKATQANDNQEGA